MSNVVFNKITQLESENYACSLCSQLKLQTESLCEYTYNMKECAEKYHCICELNENIKNALGSVIAEYIAQGLYFECESVKCKYSNYTIYIKTDKTNSDRHQKCTEIKAYLYQSEHLEGHQREASAGIRFITPKYEELFRVPDGEYVDMKSQRGETVRKKVRYVDDYHCIFGDRVFHICQLAEIMQTNGYSLNPSLNRV